MSLPLPQVFGKKGEVVPFLADEGRDYEMDIEEEEHTKHSPPRLIPTPPPKRLRGRETRERSNGNGHNCLMGWKVMPPGDQWSGGTK